MRPCLHDHALDGVRGALPGLLGDGAAGLQAFAKSGDLGAVDEGPPRPVGPALAEVELHGVRADVDDGIAGRAVIEERGQASRIVHVGVAAEAHATDRSHDGRPILRLDGHGARAATVRRHVGDLGHAAVDGVADTSLVDPDHADGAARRNHLVEELVERVGLSPERDRGQPERLDDPRRLVLRERECGLHDRGPALQPVGTDLLEHLDIHEVVADLDIVTRCRQQVQLVALLHRPGREGREGGLGRPEALAERAPLPARPDRRHPWAPSRSRNGSRADRTMLAGSPTSDRPGTDHPARRKVRQCRTNRPRSAWDAPELSRPALHVRPRRT